jgi:hypothetical protein
VALSHWMRVFETVGNLAQLSGRFRRPDPAAEPPAVGGGGMLGQIETRLAGVVVAALKEAFDRDRVRMDLEHAQFEAERRRAEEALRAELRRQAADRALSQVRLIAVMAIGVWMLSAALAVWMPGMRTGLGRGLLGGGWLFVLATLGTAFAGWQRISAWSAASGDADPSTPAPDERAAPWLLLVAIALSGAALLAAL